MCRGTSSPSGINNEWNINVSVVQEECTMLTFYGFKECCILIKDNVSDIIEQFTVV